ncbi:19630_t:CDS:2, partial [Dentiscutata erythropus]
LTLKQKMNEVQSIKIIEAVANKESPEQSTRKKKKLQHNETTAEDIVQQDNTTMFDSSSPSSQKSNLEQPARDIDQTDAPNQERELEKQDPVNQPMTDDDLNIDESKIVEEEQIQTPSYKQALMNTGYENIHMKTWHEGISTAQIHNNTSKNRTPHATQIKIAYMDKFFFRTFTRNHAAKPAHQLEFNQLLYMVQDRYKTQHKILQINKNNRDQIFRMLKMKLSFDFIRKYDMLKASTHDNTCMLYYCLRFANVQYELKFEEVRRLMEGIESEIKEELPNLPERMPQEILNIIPFNLPITDRHLTKPTVQVLRKMFTFISLPESYFDEKREKLPQDPKDLILAVASFFPIKERANNKEKAKAFIQKILEEYSLPLAFVPEYLSVNPTKKPDLLVNYKKLKKVKIVVLMISIDQLDRNRTSPRRNTNLPNTVEELKANIEINKPELTNMIRKPRTDRSYNNISN